MTTRPRDHWEAVWREQSPETLSWHQDHSERSLALITERVAADTAIIDVGDGDSPLAGDLLRHGYRDVSVLDIADAALAQGQRRAEHVVGRGELVLYLIWSDWEDDVPYLSAGFTSRSHGANGGQLELPRLRTTRHCRRLCQWPRETAHWRPRERPAQRTLIVVDTGPSSSWSPAHSRRYGTLELAACRTRR